MKKEKRKLAVPAPKKAGTLPSSLWRFRYRRPRKIKEIIDDTLTVIALAGAGTAKKKPPGSLA